MSAQASGPGASGQNFKCPNCGGEMNYDAAVRAMKCAYCGHVAAAAPAPTASAPVVAQQQQLQQGPPGPQAPWQPPAPGPREIPLSQGLALAPKGLGVALQSVQCRDCGATVNLGPNDRTAQCTYCASSMVMPVASDASLITPESLVPFQVPRERATESFKGWLKTLWFRPSDLGRMARLDQIVGVYVPFWTFDAWVRSDWQAERGWYYYETEEYTTVENGETVTRTREVQRTRWEPAWGWRQDFYDDVLVCGSKGLPANLVDKFSTFNTQALVGYAPSYLAGWRAESYAIDLPNAWVHGQQKIVQSQQSRCAGDVGGDTHRGLTVSNRYANETFKHVLLPVFVAAYRYSNKPFRFLVNGQTGEVVGEAPLSFWKIFLLVLLIVGIAVGAFLVWQSQQGSTGLRDSPRATYRLAQHARGVEPTAVTT
jgi:DNA-directed RNA polymerase subunit RPC12/RpoP